MTRKARERKEEARKMKRKIMMTTVKVNEDNKDNLFS